MSKPLSLVVSLGVLGMAACERKPEASGPQVPAVAPAPPAEAAKTQAAPAPPQDLPEDTRQAKVEAKLRKLVADQLGVSTDKLLLEAQFVRDLGADSLDLVELVMAMEEEFNLTITDEYAGKMKTVGDAVKILIWLGAR